MEIPDSLLGIYKKKVPICFYEADDSGTRVNRCDGFAYDMITIKKKTATIAYVGVTLMFQNADKCHFYGVGRWDGQLLHASTESMNNDICRLKISINNEGARITHVSNECGPAKGFCAYHGSFTGAGPLPKAR